MGCIDLPPVVPSPAISDDSHDVAPEGLLGPQLPWRLEWVSANSPTSFRDREDYSRPIGSLVRGLAFYILPFCTNLEMGSLSMMENAEAIRRLIPLITLPNDNGMY